MVVTFVLRLLDERLAHGEIVGEAEHVASGTCFRVRSASDLLGFVRAAAAGDPVVVVAADTEGGERAAGRNASAAAASRDVG